MSEEVAPYILSISIEQHALSQKLVLEVIGSTGARAPSTKRLGLDSKSVALQNLVGHTLYSLTSQLVFALDQLNYLKGAPSDFGIDNQRYTHEEVPHGLVSKASVLRGKVEIPLQHITHMLSEQFLQAQGRFINKSYKHLLSFTYRLDRVFGETPKEEQAA